MVDKDKSGVPAWMRESDEETKKAIEEGKPLINESGIVTPDARKNVFYDFPWQEHKATDKNMDKTMCSFYVNAHTKAVMDYLRRESGLSDRKRLEKIIRRFATDMAKKIENGEIDFD